MKNTQTPAWFCWRPWPLALAAQALMLAAFSFVAMFSGPINAQNLLQDGGFEMGRTAGPGTAIQIQIQNIAGASTNDDVCVLPLPTHPTFLKIELRTLHRERSITICYVGVRALWSQ